ILARFSFSPPAPVNAGAGPISGRRMVMNTSKLVEWPGYAFLPREEAPCLTHYQETDHGRTPRHPARAPAGRDTDVRGRWLGDDAPQHAPSAALGASLGRGHPRPASGPASLRAHGQYVPGHSSVPQESGDPATRGIIRPGVAVAAMSALAGKNGPGQ